MFQSQFCTRGSIGSAQEFACRADSLLRKYAWLTEAHLVDFFTNQLWLLVPESWRSAVDGHSEDFFEVFQPEVCCGESRKWQSLSNESNRGASRWPGDLIAFVEECQRLSLVRNNSELLPSAGSVKDHVGIKFKKIHEAGLADLACTACSGGR